MLIKGIFTSVWDGDTEISSNATLDTETNELSIEQVDADGMYLNSLDSETFTSEDGKVYDVCPECHEAVLRCEMREVLGNQLVEFQVCDVCEFERSI